MAMLPMAPNAASGAGGPAAPSGGGSQMAGAISRALGSLGGSSVQPAPQMQGPMQRRMESIDKSPLKQISDSLGALKHIPDQKTREDLAYPLMKAEYMARNQKGPA